MNVLELLRAKHPAPEWAFFSELRNSVGFTRVTRTADAMAFNTFMSRGLEVHGFEVKRDRRDWLRELKDPAKADELFQYSDRWWLAVSDEKIVKEGELPRTWGLLAPTENGKALRVVKEAPRLKSKPFARGFLAMIMRRVHEERVDPRIVGEEVNRQVEAQRERFEESKKVSVESAVTMERQKYARLQKAVDQFEAASGVKIDVYGGAQIGAAFKLALMLNPALLKGQVRSLLNLTDGISASLRSKLAEIEAESPTSDATEDVG